MSLAATDLPWHATWSHSTRVGAAASLPCDYSTAVFCILPARLSCSACSVLKTVPHWNPLFATRVFHPGIFGIHKIPVYIRVLLHSRVGLTTMSCTRVFCLLILAETHEYSTTHSRVAYSGARTVPGQMQVVRFCTISHEYRVPSSEEPVQNASSTRTVGPAGNLVLVPVRWISSFF